MRFYLYFRASTESPHAIALYFKAACPQLTICLLKSFEHWTSGGLLASPRGKRTPAAPARSILPISYSSSQADTIVSTRFVEAVDIPSALQVISRKGDERHDTS